jgi:hypothetical protein
METLNRTLQSACKEFEEDLVIYYYGEGSAAERELLESHLTGCSRCRSFLEDLSRFLPQMAKTKELPPSFWDNYYKEMMEKLAVARERTSWWRTLFAPVRLWAVPAFGAAVVLVIGLTLTLDNVAWNPLSEPKQALIPQEILNDPNRVEFFKSMELVESLRKLEALDSTGEPKNPGGSRTI